MGRRGRATGFAALATAVVSACSIGGASVGDRADPTGALGSPAASATRRAEPPRTSSGTATPSGAGATTPTSVGRLGCPGTACLTITVAGDILLHEPLWAQARRDALATGSQSAFDFAPLLRGQQQVVSSSDLAFCHLETPVGRPRGPFRGYPSFAVPPQVAAAIAATGYDACSTASNHTMDDGTAGIDRTLAALDAAGVAHVGSARTAAESRRPATFTVRGTRVALLSYTYGLNGSGVPRAQPWRVHVIDPARILRDAHSARAAGADVVVVALHWGTEYHHDPTPEQRALAGRLLSSPDVDLVYGHHAHVVQPVQRLHGKWVVYGLGNDVAAQSVGRADTYQGLLVRVQLVRDAAGHWRGGRLDWVASGIATTPAYRWVDLGAALARPGLSPATRSAYTAAYRATQRYVEDLGAARQGAAPLADVG